MSRQRSIALIAIALIALMSVSAIAGCGDDGGKAYAQKVADSVGALVKQFQQVNSGSGISAQRAAMLKMKEAIDKAKADTGKDVPESTKSLKSDLDEFLTIWSGVAERGSKFYDYILNVEAVTKSLKTDYSDWKSRDKLKAGLESVRKQVDGQLTSLKGFNPPAGMSKFHAALIVEYTTMRDSLDRMLKGIANEDKSVYEDGLSALSKAGSGLSAAAASMDPAALQEGIFPKDDMARMSQLGEKIDKQLSELGVTVPK